MTHRNPLTARLLAGACVLLLAVGGASPLWAGEPEDYEAAKTADTLEAWEAFLKAYPTGTHAQGAREAHDARLLVQAERSARDADRLETLFARCRTSAASERVFALWDDALWGAAESSKTLDTYRRYLTRFPTGRHHQDARAALEEAMWRECQAAGTREALAAYLKEYPSGKHVKEANQGLEDREFAEARAQDSIEAYESFLQVHRSHEAARRRLRELRYKRAEKMGTLEEWRTFHDDNRGYSASAEGPDFARMMGRAGTELERLLYDTILAQPTLELCREYLRRYSERPRAQQVVIRMEPCLYDEASRSADSALWFEYLEKYPTGYRDAEARQRLEAALFAKLDDRKGYDAIERYLRLAPRQAPALQQRLEPLLFGWANRAQSIEVLDLYLARYPAGPHLAEVQARLDPLLYQKAQTEDWHTAYAEYLKKCPNGQSASKAQERLAFLRANRAVVEAEYPKLVEGDGYWKWVVRFRETSGRIGFRVHGVGSIHDPRGGRWGTYGGSISRETITVAPGGSGSDDYWCRSSDHVLCGGYASFTWTGEDAGGHSISVEEKVELRHTGCPGPKK